MHEHKQPAQVARARRRVKELVKQDAPYSSRARAVRQLRKVEASTRQNTPR